ncbi:MAG: endolytic transglycosylase MltG [Gammaproteobacteria bacterium]
MGARLKTLLRALGVIIVLAAVAVTVAAWQIQQRLALPAVPGEAPIRLVIEPGMSFRAMARRLAEQGGYAHPRLLAYYARYKQLAARVQAGEYELSPGLSLDHLLAQVTSGEVVTYSLTVVEGWTFREFRAALAATPTVDQTLDPQMTAAAVMTQLGMSGIHPEGRFFPDTYVFARDTADTVILKQAAQAMQTRLDDIWTQRSQDCPLASMDEALILASIIEKETGRADERPHIAGVFCRRLKKGMRLQTDPTVIYGLGPTFNGDITRRDLRTDTPYNTYTRSGLPPTPIALPGQGSLSAAVNPLEGETLYFVATGKGDGSHYFSRTLAEHEQAVARYLKTLRAN